MKLREAIARYEEFLRGRLLGPRRRDLLVLLLRCHLVPALGRTLLPGTALPQQLDVWVDSLLPSLRADTRYALGGFRRYVVRTRCLGPLGRAADGYLLALHRLGRGPGTLKVHRLALVQLARLVASETKLGPRLTPLLSRVFEEMHQKQDPVLSSAVNHFASFLAMEQVLDPSAAGLRKASAPERRLDRMVLRADRLEGFTGALARYLRELRDERQLSRLHLLGVHARASRFFRAMRSRGCRRLPDIHREDVAAYRDRALTAGVTRIHNDLSMLRCLFAFLEREGEVEHNPVEGVRAKVFPRRPRVALSLAELRCLLSAPERDLQRLALSAGTPSSRLRHRFLALRDRAAIALLIETGLRPSELLSVTVDDIQWVPGAIRIDGKGSRATPKRSRLVYLESPTALSALRDYLAVRPVGPYRALLLSRRATPLKPQDLIALVARRARQADLGRPVRPYDLRVSFASRLVARGVDPFALRALMGHDDIRTTLGLYTALTLAEVREVWKEANPLAPRPRSPGGRK